MEQPQLRMKDVPANDKELRQTIADWDRALHISEKHAKDTAALHADFASRMGKDPEQRQLNAALLIFMQRQKDALDMAALWQADRLLSKIQTLAKKKKLGSLIETIRTHLETTYGTSFSPTLPQDIEVAHRLQDQAWQRAAEAHATWSDAHGSDSDPIYEAIASHNGIVTNRPDRIEDVTVKDAVRRKDAA